MCIKPISNLLENSVQLKSNCLIQEMHDKKCSNITFYAGYAFVGAEKYIDGILGLAPPKELGESHFLFSMKRSGIINHAKVSFHLK